MPDFDPTHWHWIIGDDETRCWSSATGAYIDTLPVDAGVTRIGSEQELNEVLAVYGLIGPYRHLHSYAADKRWRVETGGISIARARINTDRASQAMIAGAVTYLTTNPDAGEVQYKAESGWATLDRAAMLAIGVAVGAHIQACFAVERAIDDDIDAGTITTAAQIETDARWTS